jgi:hypothetical protein
MYLIFVVNHEYDTVMIYELVQYINAHKLFQNSLLLIQLSYFYSRSRI